MDVAQLDVRFRAEGADAVTAAANKVSASVESTAERIGKAGRRMALGITTPIVAAAGFAFNQASNLGESTSKAQVIFGDSVAGVVADSKLAASAAGLSQSAYLESASNFGQFFQLAGKNQDEAAGLSGDIVQLAADMASFNNTTVDEALLALQSGLSGEAEPLRRYGVFLSDAAVQAKALEMGLVDANGELSEENKILARNAIIFEQSTNAQGDYARTAGGAANQMRTFRASAANLAAMFGQKLLPIGTKLISWATKLVNGLEKISPKMQTIVVVAAALAAALGPILIGISAMIPAIGAMGAAFGLLLGPVGLIVAAVAALVIAWQTDFLGIASRTTEFIGDLVDVFQRLRDEGISPIEAAIRAFGSALEDLTGIEMSAFFKNIADAAGALLNGDWMGFAAEVSGALASINWSGMVAGALGIGGDLAVAIALELAGYINDLWSGIQSLDWGVIIPDITWSDFIPVLSWAGKVAELAWDEFVTGTVALFQYVTSLDWGEFVTGAIDLAGKVAVLQWNLFVTAVDLAAKVHALAWSLFVTGAVNLGEYVASLDWGAFVSGAVDITSYIASLSWDAYVSGVVNVAAYIDSLDWGDFVTGAVDLASKVGAFAWATFVTAVNLAARVGAFAWSTFVTAIDLTTYVAPFVWSTFVKAVDLAGKVGEFLWSNFVPSFSWPAIDGWPGWGTYVPTISWGLYIPALSWPSKSEILSALTLGVAGGGDGEAEGGSNTEDAGGASGGAKRGKFGGKGLAAATMMVAAPDFSAFLQAHDTAFAEAGNKYNAFATLATTSGQNAGSGFTNTFTPSLNAAVALLGAVYASLFAIFVAIAATGTNMGMVAGQGFNSGIVAGTSAAVAAAGGAAGALNGIFAGVAASMTNLGIAGGQGFAYGVQGGMAVATGAAYAGASAIRGALMSIGNLYGQGFSVGNSLGQGIAAGIGSMIGAVAAQAAAIVGAAVNAARNAGAIRSPSKVMADKVGLPLAQGVAVGLGLGADGVIKAAKGLINGAVPGVPSFAGTGMAGAGSGTTINNYRIDKALFKDRENWREFFRSEIRAAALAGERQ